MEEVRNKVRLLDMDTWYEYIDRIDELMLYIHTFRLVSAIRFATSKSLRFLNYK